MGLPISEVMRWARAPAWWSRRLAMDLSQEAREVRVLMGEN